MRSELPPKQVTPAVTQEPEKIQEKQEAMPSEKTGDEKPVVKKKLNYTKLIVMITAAVVAISLVAHFIFNRNLAEIEVPNVTNMTVVEAQKLLEEKQFKVELEEKYGDPDKFKLVRLWSSLRRPAKNVSRAAYYPDHLQGCGAEGCA